MAILAVFSNNLDPVNGSLTSRFINATAFYIDAPLITSEIEIDVYLQVYLPTSSTERVRIVPLGKLKDGEIKLNETDSETLVPIPYELIDTGLEMALYFTSSDTTFLEVYVIGIKCSLCQVQSGILAISEDLNTRFNEVNSRLNSMQSTLNQILAIVGAPDIVPSTLEQAFFFIQ